MSTRASSSHGHNEQLCTLKQNSSFCMKFTINSQGWSQQDTLQPLSETKSEGITRKGCQKPEHGLSCSSEQRRCNRFVKCKFCHVWRQGLKPTWHTALQVSVLVRALHGPWKGEELEPPISSFKSTPVKFFLYLFYS